MSVRLDNAIAEFEDETLDLTLAERISGLRKALMWNAFMGLKRLGSKKRQGILVEEDQNHIECMKFLNQIEKMYLAEFRMNKISGKSIENMDKEFLKKIKEEKGSIGSIVRDIKPMQKSG